MNGNNGDSHPKTSNPWWLNTKEKGQFAIVSRRNLSIFFGVRWWLEKMVLYNPYLIFRFKNLYCLRFGLSNWIILLFLFFKKKKKKTRIYSRRKSSEISD